MPCDRIITQSVDLNKCGDIPLLLKAAECVMRQEYGQWYHVPTGRYFQLVNGKLQGDAKFVGKVADELKQAYSKQVILKTAKLQGWKVKDLGNNKLQVVKARY